MTALYRQLAEHYLGAIHAGALKEGDRLPSVRTLMNDHGVSLATALQACRHLEDLGWAEARPRSGYFVQRPHRARLPPAAERPADEAPDPVAFAGIHERVSEILARGQQSEVQVNLAQAIGAPEMYPAGALQRIMGRQLREQPQALATVVRRHGHPALRKALVQRALARGISAAPEEVIVTHGCTEAVNLALRAVTRPGDTVAVESPTFYGLLQLIESLSLRVLELPTSPSTGLSPEALELALSQGVGDIKALVLMPTLHNPLGCVMPDAHKQRIVELAATHDVALIEDDIYGDMGRDDTPWRTLKSFDTRGQVIHCGSLNKVLAPGLRLGWMLAGRWQARVEMLKYAQSRYAEELSQTTVAEFIASSAWPRHLRQLRQVLNHQRERLAEGVAAHFPQGTRASLPEGGLLLWVQLPEGVSSFAIFEAALQQGIKIAPGRMFSNGARYDHCIRLSCGLARGPVLDRALATLGGIVARELDRT